MPERGIGVIAISAIKYLADHSVSGRERQFLSIRLSIKEIKSD